MASAAVGGVLKQISRLFGGGTVAGLGEAQLLDRFVSHRDEVAFEALLARHGPMVLAVCRRLIPDPHTAEDAFQATFLVLVRRAGSIRDGDRLGPWLYGVAHRIARRARSDLARRRGREQGGDAVSAHEPAVDPTENPVGPELHEELQRLSTSYRDVVVLCDLEGRTHEEAARLLGWPLGTVKGRLSRARDQLRGRLARRGLNLTAGALVAAFEHEARAAVPSLLHETTVRAAMVLAAGETITAAGLVSAGVLDWAERVSQAMLWSQTKWIAVSLLTTSAVLTTGVLAFQEAAGGGQPPPAADPSHPLVTAVESSRAEPPDRGDPGGKAAQDETEAGLETARRDLARARIDLATSEFNRALALFGRKQDLTLSTLHDLSRQILDTGRRVMGSQFNEVQALEAHAKRMEELRERLKAGAARTPRFPGQEAAFDPALADYYVSEARLWIAEARAGQPLTDFDRPAAATPEKAAPSALVPGGTIPLKLDPKTRAILAALDRPLSLEFPNDVPLEDVLTFIRQATDSPELPGGIPIYVDPAGLMEAEKTETSPVHINLEGIPLKTTLRLLLKQIGLAYMVRDGLLYISSADLLQRELLYGPAAPGYGVAPETAPTPSFWSEISGNRTASELLAQIAAVELGIKELDATLNEQGKGSDIATYRKQLEKLQSDYDALQRQLRQQNIPGFPNGFPGMMPGNNLEAMISGNLAGAMTPGTPGMNVGSPPRAGEGGPDPFSGALGAGIGFDGVADPNDPENKPILEALGKRLDLPFDAGIPLNDALKYLTEQTRSEALPHGLVFYLDPASLESIEKTPDSTVTIDLKGVRLGVGLRLLLRQVGLVYVVRDGLVLIGSPKHDEFRQEAGLPASTQPGGFGGGGFR